MVFTADYPVLAPAGEIRRAKQLLDSTAPTRQEFDQLKTRALTCPPGVTEIGGTA